MSHRDDGIGFKFQRNKFSVTLIDKKSLERYQINLYVIMKKENYEFFNILS